MNYGTETNEFRKDVVRIALTSGLTRKQVAKQWVAGKRKRHSRAFDSVPFQKVRERLGQKNLQGSI